ncbi:hypothetical protein BASA60_006099 [Batrachochytrium salamandrivorans]|nr:hypothetical protein BASA60_006099 [Batrachochytrium salamandrivorans]
MANSEISVSSVDHRQEPSPSTTFSIYGLAAVSITYLRSILAPILGHQMEHVSKIDRRTTKHGARFRITVPEDRQRNIIQRLERQSKQTHWRIRQNYRHRRPDQPRPTAPPPPLSRQILAVNVANISNKRPAIRHIVRNTRLWAISETCITSSKFRFTVPGFDVIQHPATGPGRRGIALGIPSCFGGHEHGSAVGTMILAKVPNFTPECLWIVGSVYVGHSGATTNYSRREAFASIRQSLDRVVPFDNNHPVLIFGDWNTDPQRLQRIVHSWGHARALLTSPRVDRQTAVADHFVIRTSIRAEAQGQPPAPRAPTISRHHCLEATDRIATSNYWDVLADGASDDTDTDTDVHQLTSQFLESANAVADQLSLRLSPPATRSIAGFYLAQPNVPYWQATLHGKHSLPLQPIATLTQSSATLFEMSGLDSRLLPPNSREWMVANNGSSTLTISTVLYQTVEPISYSLLHVPCLETVPVVLQSLHCTTPMA